MRFQNRSRVTLTQKRRRQLIVLITVFAVFAVPSLLTHHQPPNPLAVLHTANGGVTVDVGNSAFRQATAQIPDLPTPMPTATPHAVAELPIPKATKPAVARDNDETVTLRHHPNFPAGAPVPRPYRLDTTKFSEKQRRVVEGIRHAFVNYKKYAWGHDELAPLRKTYTDWSQGQNSGIGLTAIESLDTMWLAGLYDEFNEVIEYLKSPQHTFARHIEVGIFETTIRVLGGLLSSYELSGELILLDKAYDIGRRLFHCIEGRTIPHASVYLDSGETSNPGWLGGSQSLAEVTTIQLEFKKLSVYTGDMKYDKATTEIMHRVLEHIPSSGLYSIYISMSNGSPASGQVTLGARGDSFYEYLAKQWALTNYTEKWLENAYRKVANGVVEHLKVQINDTHAFVAESSQSTNINLEFKMDHLVCFVVGMLQLGKNAGGDPRITARDDKAAGDIGRVCHNIYRMTPTGLGVEIVRFESERNDYRMYPSPGARHYIMRPEVIEAMFYMQRFHPEAHDEWGAKAWAMYEKMEQHLKVPSGWVGLADAMRLDSEKRDKMESFFVAETLKYAFLTAATRETAAEQLPLSDWVFNTEAHPFKVMSAALSTRG
jgi:hypothetical protein